MNVMVKGSHQGSGIGKLMGSEGIFVPFPLEAVQAIKELNIVHVEFVRTNANYGTCRHNVVRFAIMLLDFNKEV